ncbi:unnamed protein product [Rotaria socialis]|uniref:Uncharacterized protein n=1 Tax=Rotaria socialis TaxID=392032 RepID=A0A817V2Y1_9BILA|nr:unnamed protein product [Rotaria socialis]CAF3341094.1 unnamed protein product [Rotaria socialis]CAF3464967.1 unnamed protein product [Rotaria socialis]CAF3708742.1 unnamed protein product [Rotaria socialis]CAF3804890.1 unnamed protein product [Rotaria socialis]
MGNAESSQSTERGGIGGFNVQSSFRRQSPNVARLIRGENSQKMEYEFPISDVNTTNLGRYSHRSGETNNHMIISGKTNRQISERQINRNDNLLSKSKTSSNETPSLWLSLTSCFGCRTRDSRSSTMNPLRDKVHAIRIVRASNDLTPAVFDSHYNIITLEQLRECENNGAGALGNTYDPTNPNAIEASHNGNGTISATKKESSCRTRKKKKKRAAAAAYAARTMPPEDDDTYETTQDKGK